jgi:RND family efflux transporter MFP subunit
LLSGVLLGLLVGMGCADEAAPPPEPVRGVKTITVSERPRGALRRFWGVLAARDSSELAFEVGGRVREVAVEAGDRVEPGQRLASLDPRRHELALEAALAELTSARARLADAARVRRNLSSLHERAVAAQGSVEDARNKERAAGGEVERAQVAVDLARRDLAHATLEAPFAGVIAERRLEPHQEVPAGSTVFVIQNDAALEVDLLVPEIFIGSVHVGQPVRVMLSGWDFRGVSLDGAVSQVAAIVGRANAYPVRVALGRAPESVRPGMTAEVEFRFGSAVEQEAWRVPLTALFADGAAAGEHVTERELFAFVLDAESSTVRRRAVRILNVEGGDALIGEGLAAGDVVVVAGVHQLREGQQVRRLEDGAAGAAP